MARREHIVNRASSRPEIPESFSIPRTVEWPTGVDYNIKTGISVTDEGVAFSGTPLILLGGDNGDKLRATLNRISGDCGHFTSCETALVRTTKLQELEKPAHWNFRAPLSSTEVIPQY